MPIVNMTQAAELAGIGRTTLYRKAKKGILSTTKMPDGSPGVDTSELFRVFPVKQQDGTHETPQVEHVGTVGTPIETALLLQKLKHLEELLEVERARNHDLSQALRLIEFKAPKQGFWSRLFGK